MWIDDPTGTERQKNPKAKVRTTESGRVQVLIFRRAAKRGQRKLKRDRAGNIREVPASYPGAPGRIAVREAGRPNTTPGRVAGAVAPGNVGVKWRFPGLRQRDFLTEGITRAALRHGLIPGQIEEG